MYTLANKLLVLVSALAHINLTRAACLSLRSSQGCPGFSKEFISTNATSRFSWYPKDDITAFDKALSDYVVGQANLDEFQSVFRCGGLDDLGGFASDHGISVIRYHRSMACADIIFSETNIDECYGDRAAEHRRRGLSDESAEMQVAEILASSTVNVRPSQPMPLCRSTCESWIDSLHSITTNSTLCKPDKGINRSASLDSLRKKCNLNMYNGTPDRCVDGDANELKTCGYQRVEDWCKYCDYASDYAEVCQSVGVEVKEDQSNKGDKDKLGIPTHTNHHNSDSEDDLVAELEQQKRHEHAFRVVAIVLSIVAGVCIISLIALISMGRRQTPASAYNIYGNRSSSGSGKDDSTLLHLGANTTGNAEKTPDFVDCFVAAVGKPRHVVRPFFARRDDEISLQSGDKVTLQMAFDDGWVVGKNLTSGNEGTFPLMCVMENLPPSLPAQWSVLPESKNTSVENLRNSSRTDQRLSPRPPIPGARPTTGDFDNGTGSTGNLTAPSVPLITTSTIPSSSGLQSTRTSPSHEPRRGDKVTEEFDRENKGKGILDRLIGAFSPTGATGNDSPTNDDETAGFFRRLIASPFGARDKIRMPEISRPKSGRPHSFNVHHVVHVGLDNPNFPQPLVEQNASISTVPSSIQSNSRYPIITAQSSTGRNPNIPPTAPVNPRSSNLSYGEFVSANSSQATTAGNQSTETYRTAEQSSYGGSRVPLATASRAPYLC